MLPGPEPEPTQEQDLIIAVLGTQNAGKSTILNSLLGAEILPSAHQIETASITQVEHNGELEPGVFQCISSTQAPISFGDDPAERRDSHDRVREWIHKMNKAEGMPQIRVCANLTTLADYTSLGLGGVSVFDIPGTNEVAGKEDRLRDVAQVLNQVHFVCIVIPYTDVGADSVEVLARLVREHANESCCVCLFINKMDSVPQEAQEDFRHLAQETLFAKRQRLFNRRPTSMHFTRGEVGLVSACRGCDLRSCKLLDRVLHFTPLFNKDDQGELVKRWLRAKNLIPELQEQPGHVGPFLSLPPELPPTEKNARDLHNEIALALRSVSGNDEIWSVLVAEFVRARVGSVAASLDWARDFGWRALARTEQAWRRLLYLKKGHRELSRCMERAARYGLLHDRLLEVRAGGDHIIAGLVVDFVAKVVREPSSLDTDEFSKVLQWGLMNLAVSCERHHAGVLLDAVERRSVDAEQTMSEIATLLGSYIDSIGELQRQSGDRRVSRKLSDAAQQTLERATKLESRSFSQLSARLDGVDWTFDRSHPASYFQPRSEAGCREGVTCISDYRGDIQKLFTSEGVKADPEIAGDILQRMKQAERDTLQEFGHLQEFAHTMYPMTVEAAMFHIATMDALDCLDAKIRSLSVDPARVKQVFKAWWNDRRQSWLAGRERRTSIEQAENIKSEVTHFLDDRHARYLRKERVKLGLAYGVGGAIGIAALGSILSGAGALALLGASEGSGAIGSALVGIFADVKAAMKGTDKAVEKAGKERLATALFAGLFRQYLLIFVSAMKLIRGEVSPAQYISVVRSNSQGLWFGRRHGSPTPSVISNKLPAAAPAPKIRPSADRVVVRKY